LEIALTDIESRVVGVIQHGMPRSLTPYEDMAKLAGVETRQLLDVLKKWKAEGKLRRIGAIVNHFEVGLQAGMMAVWQIEPAHVEEVGNKFATFEEVSHVYERSASQAWPYNLYTMVHGSNIDEVKKTLGEMSDLCGANNYLGLATVKELKKAPPVYIMNDDSSV
jgi:siroheme decarboxylase